MFRRDTAPLRDSVDQGQGLAGRGHAVARGTLVWCAFSLSAAPILLRQGGRLCVLWEVLSALGLCAGDVIGHGHWLSFTARGATFRTVPTVTAASASVAALGPTIFIQPVLAGAGLAVRLVGGGVHQAGLLVVTATAGAPAAVSVGARALAGVRVARLLALALQQGERVAVGVPQH